jgi:hypothetical protein
MNQKTTKLSRPTDAPALYAQDGQGYDAIVHAHYFLGTNDWLVTEYDPGDDLAFGWCCLGGDTQNAELGYTSLDELESISLPVILHSPQDETITFHDVLHVEYDTGWPRGMSLREGIAELDRRQGRG